MAELVTRFTLSSYAGSLVIDEPGGFDRAVVKLERNKDFASLIEFYDQPLLYYGNGYEYIRAAELEKGPDVQISLTIELSDDNGDTYETLFVGLLDLSTKKELDFYKLECGLLRNDFWQKFMNRKDTAVDISDTTGLDGNTVTLRSSKTIDLPSQKIRKRYQGYVHSAITYPGAISASEYLQFDMDEEPLSEISTKFVLPSVVNSEVPVSLFNMEEDGVYTFDIRLEISKVYYSGSCTPGLGGTASRTIAVCDTILDLYIQINEDTPVAFTKTNSPAGPNRSTYFTYSGSLTLNKGDQVHIYADMLSGIADGYENIWIHAESNTAEVEGISGYDVGTCAPILFTSDITIGVPSGTATPSYINVTGDTTIPDTDVEGFELKRAAENILNKIISRNGVLISDDLEPRNNDCVDRYFLARGLNIRGYSLSEKPFFMSFDTWWNGANPLLCLGLGYTKVGTTEYIEIEQRDNFFDPVPVLNLDFVNNIEVSYNKDGIYKNVEIGFEKWSAESASGIDDPQSKRTYSSKLKSVGTDVKVLSKFVGASLAIEQTRRNRKEQGKDWRLDEDVFVISLGANASPPWYGPELDENFTSVTNILNSDTRYNLRITAARVMKRWMKWLQGCLQWSLEPFDFVSGEGNFDATTVMTSSDCEGGTVVESQDMANNGLFIMLPISYKFTHYLTWEQYKLIRQYRKKAIGVSRENTDHLPCYIDTLEYSVMDSKATFIVRPAEFRFL